MLTFAAQTFAEAGPTITPEEPATLSLLLVGAGTLAVYAVLSGRWRRMATMTAGRSLADVHESAESPEPVCRAA